MTEALPFILGLSVGAGVVWVIMRGRPVCSRKFFAERRSDDRAEISRLTDLVGQLQSKRDRALEQVTDGANATVKRMAAILKGDA